MDIEKSIEAAKKDFEKRFKSSKYYDNQTQDSKHLDSISSQLKINSGSNVLDFGTGSGYLLFALADIHNDSTFTGVDIVEDTLSRNNKYAKENKVNNAHFVSYNGTKLPFADATFDVVVTRYVIHHVPNIKEIFSEINRVLKPNGQFFIADPTPYSIDKNRFVDDYMHKVKDGHIKFYTIDELLNISHRTGFVEESHFFSSIRFPRKSSGEYKKLISAQSAEILDKYNLEFIKDEVYITEKVLNLSLSKVK